MKTAGKTILKKNNLLRFSSNVIILILVESFLPVGKMVCHIPVSWNALSSVDNHSPSELIDNAISYQDADLPVFSIILGRPTHHSVALNIILDQAGETTEVKACHFGFREIELKDQQFFVNGVSVMLAHDVALPTGKFGLVVSSAKGGQTTITFDHFSVWSLAEATPTPTPTLEPAGG